jgi:hypothetical protein
MNRLASLAATIAMITAARPVLAQNAAASFLGGVHKHELLTSTVPANGDQNPYALIVAPVDAGGVKAGDVLVGNFNNSANLQGAGTTIVSYAPATRSFTTFATIPRELKGCPGGVGLSTAMAMLKTGWVIVGSAPSTDGTTKTLGAGCLIVLDPHGQVVDTITGPNISDPWGNMAVIDRGDTASLFVSNAGFGIGAPGQPTQHQATVLRIDLTIPAGQKPHVSSQTVIASGLPAAADASVFLIGPTGLALATGGTLYLSDAIGNRVAAIPDAATRSDSAGTGVEITKDGMLHRPLAMTLTSNGNLLVVNGLDGNVVEIDPASHKQLGVKLIDGDEAQTPPGSGDLFGIAIKPDHAGFYYVEDDMNTLEEAK